jgi:hypothetical protein
MVCKDRHFKSPFIQISYKWFTPFSAAGKVRIFSLASLSANRAGKDFKNVFYVAIVCPNTSKCPCELLPMVIASGYFFCQFEPGGFWVLAFEDDVIKNNPGEIYIDFSRNAA